MTRQIFFDQKISVYELNQNDQLVVINGYHMYEPFRDYSFSDFDSSIIKTRKITHIGQSDGESGCGHDIFTFTNSGSFNMTIIDLGCYNTFYNITIKVKPYDINSSENNDKENQKNSVCVLL